MSEISSDGRCRPSIAVIGSGPSGCYTAQFLRKELPDAEISIFEALPVPYGLVRYGVAADHQGTKAVTRQFDRMFARNRIAFVGNTRIGIDVEFEAITSAFDIVVIATGLPNDRALPIPHEDGAHVVGAGALLRTLNAFPTEAAGGDGPLDRQLGEQISVVGNGNVAMDVVRLLAKTSAHFAGSDIHDGALDVLRPTPLRAVHVVGRSSVENAKFDLAMLRELCALDTVEVRVDGLDDATPGPVAELLRETLATQSERENSGGTTVVTFHFDTVPTAIRYADGRTVLDVTHSSGQTDSFTADTVVTAVGFCQADETRDDVPAAAWAGAHVYRVGWVAHGPVGNIAENRRRAQTASRQIVADLAAGAIPARNSAGLGAILPNLPAATGFGGWRAIDETECRDAGAHRVRRKITDLGEMVAIARTFTDTGEERITTGHTA